MYSPFGKMWYLADKDVFEEEYMIESEVFDLLKISDDLFTYDTPLGMVFDEFKRLSSTEDDLFTYEMGFVDDFYFPCIKKPDDNLTNDDFDVYEPRVCYDENEQIYAEAMILFNKRLIRGNDEEVLTDDELSDLEEEKEPTCNSNEDGYCNGGKLPRMIQVGNMTYLQNYDWYKELEDGDLKDENFKEKAILEGSWGHENREGKNFSSWLKECFGNYHELDYELMRKLEEYWRGKKEEEESSDDA
ncbi:hypothetical protein Tco_1115606 [Tanacetum coccineum]